MYGLVKVEWTQLDQKIAANRPHLSSANQESVGVASFVLKANPTCHSATSCEACMRMNSASGSSSNKPSCYWCASLALCSTGSDREYKSYNAGKCKRDAQASTCDVIPEGKGGGDGGGGTGTGGSGNGSASRGDGFMTSSASAEALTSGSMILSVLGSLVILLRKIYPVR